VDRDQNVLQQQLSDALRRVPGARALIEFGSRREGKADTFSDVDLQLLVDDCTTALPVFLTILGDEVSPEVEWTISDDPNHYWLMAIPNSSHPWLKVDIGLDPYNNGKPENLGWSGEVVWTQDAPISPSKKIVQPNWPRPVPGTIENFILWQLIDLGRLAKFQYRGQPLNVLKFVSQLTQAVIAVEAFRSSIHDDFTDMPSTAAISDLDQSAFNYLADMNISMFEYIDQLAYRLCDAVGSDTHLRDLYERMVIASNSVIRIPD